MWPILLGLGVLAGNELLRQRARAAQEDQQQQQLRGLLGQPPEPMGPPSATGEMGVSGGSGLLANPMDRSRQLAFAAGLAGIKGLEGRGLSMLDQVMQRQQQEDQWRRSEERQAQQWGAGHDLQRAQLERGLSTDERLAQQWQQEMALRQQEFDARRAEAEGRMRIDRERLDMERRRMGAQSGGVDMPKLSAGMMWSPSASGIVAAPVPGTEPYAKAIGAQESLKAADDRIGKMLDLMSGREQTVAGKKVRVGGAGSELWGETAAQYSVLRSGIIADVARLRDMGVLQAGEMERLDKDLPDPSSLGATLRRNSSMRKAYEELRDQFRAKRAAHLREHPWLVPPPPAGFRVE